MTHEPTSSIDEILSTLAEQARVAHAGIPDAPAAIGWGDHWVRCPGPLLIEFGRVLTREEVAISELVIAGSSWEDALEVVGRNATSLLGSALMYGPVYCRTLPDGVVRLTHKDDCVWPIPPETFEAARMVGWVIEEMPEEQRVHVDAAVNAVKAHATSKVQS